LLSFVFALFVPLVWFLGAEAFEGRGRNSEILAASLAGALYLAICQFLVARKGSRKLGAKWPTLMGMTTTLLVFVVLIMLMKSDERPGTVLVGLSGCFGILAGAALAGRVALPTVSLKFCRRSLLTCGALLVVVALVVAAGVIPLVKIDPFPGAAPEKAVPVFWWIVALNLLGATLLVFIAIRATERSGFSSTALSLLALLAFVFACVLTGPAFGFLAHGPAMQNACILLFLCLAGELLVAGLVGTIACLLPE
jgi:hypothetical protein